MKVIGIEQFAVTEDFSDVQVQLRTDQKKDLPLEMTVAVLEDLLLKMNKVLNLARSQAYADGVNPAIYPARVVDATVHGAAGTGLVSLSFKN